jgi:hypothetical protein
VSAVGCSGVDGHASADPNNAGHFIDRSNLEVDARIGPPHTGVGTQGTIAATVATTADLAATPWWKVDLTADAGASGDVRLTPWRSSPEWPTARVADRRLVQAPDGSHVPDPRPPLGTLLTRWLRLGAVGKPYSMALSTSGTVPVRYRAENLPPGLAVNGEILSGTPTQAGTYQVRLSVTDDSGYTTIRTVPLVIRPAGSSTAFNRVTTGNGPSVLPEVSAGGQYVVFGSTASNLPTSRSDSDPPAEPDGDRDFDLFMFDLVTGELIQITNGETMPTDRQHWSVSEDFAYPPAVAFESDASAFDADDHNGVSDIFVWGKNREQRSIRITDGNGASTSPSMSTFGDYVAFTSSASDLVPGDTNGVDDVFLWTRSTSTITRLSGAGGGSAVALSGDGRTATMNGPGGFQMLDLTTGTVTPIAGTPASSADLAFDGHAVVYQTSTGISFWDRATGQTRAVSGVSPSPPTMSVGGTVVFYEQPSGGGGAPAGSTIREWDVATGTSKPVTSGAGTSSHPSYAGSPDILAFQSDTTNLVPEDGNGQPDVFVQIRGSWPP